MLVTLSAGKYLSSMDSLVFFQMHEPLKIFVTLGAGKHLSCMDNLVSFQVTRMGESFVTLGAGKCFFSLNGFSGGSSG